MTTHLSPIAGRLLATLTWFSLLWLAFTLPFETVAPWIRLGPIQLTNLELSLAVVLLLGGLQAWQRSRERGRRGGWGMPASWVWLWAFFILILIISALLAPQTQPGLPGLRLNALKATGRTLAGMALALFIPQIVTSSHRRRDVIISLVCGGLLVALIGLLEVVRGIPLLWLDPFRTMPTTVGPFLRLSASFDHANQAAMYIEATLPLLLAWLWHSYGRGRRWLTVWLAALALFYLEASFFTYSRTSFVTLLAVSLLLAGWLWRRQPAASRRAALFWGGFAGIVLFVTLVNTTRSPVWNLRLRSEDDKSWYQVQFDVPEQLDLQAGDTVLISLTVQNEGVLTWVNAGPNPIHIGATWRRLADGSELPQRPRWHLEHPVRPGEQIRQDIPLPVPQTPGTYELKWDMVQEYITWFGEKTGRQTITRVEVVGTLPPPAPGADTPPSVAGENFVPITVTAPIPVRRVLWNIAWRQFREHPWLGIGLDNFRLSYGRYLNAAAWDDTIHSNNWYIETGVSAGLFGGLAFLLWLGLLLADLVHTLRRPRVAAWQMGLAAALLAYGFHGLLDYFLMFNATAILFWLLIGLWLSQREDTV